LGSVRRMAARLCAVLTDLLSGHHPFVPVYGRLAADQTEPGFGLMLRGVGYI
jgi:hypothetical protein